MYGNGYSGALIEYFWKCARICVFQLYVATKYVVFNLVAGIVMCAADRMHVNYGRNKVRDYARQPRDMNIFDACIGRVSDNV